MYIYMYIYVYIRTYIYIYTGIEALTAAVRTAVITGPLTPRGRQLSALQGASWRYTLLKALETLSQVSSSSYDMHVSSSSYGLWRPWYGTLRYCTFSAKQTKLSGVIAQDAFRLVLVLR
jgi:hypothetical protein